MRFVKVVPLLIVVAMIATAFVGTGSASAWSMCKKPEPVCPEFLRYHTGQVFTGALQEGTQAHFTGGTEAICKSSSFEDTLVTENGSLEGAMSLSMSSCNATVGVLHAPWKTEHIAIEPSGTWELRISNGGSGLPGFSINGCEYTAESIVLTLEDSSLTGGAPRVIANKELLTGAGACSVKGWTATYRESPNFYAG